MFNVFNVMLPGTLSSKRLPCSLCCYSLYFYWCQFEKCSYVFLWSKNRLQLLSLYNPVLQNDKTFPYLPICMTYTSVRSLHIYLYSITIHRVLFHVKYLIVHVYSLLFAPFSCTSISCIILHLLPCLKYFVYYNVWGARDFIFPMP